MRLALLLSATFVAAVMPAFAAEEWHVVKDGANAWAYDKGGVLKDEATGSMVARVARYHGTPQTDGAVTYSFDIRGYRVDCAKAQVQQRTSERFTANVAPAAPATLPAQAPWEKAASGWPLTVKTFVCDGQGLAGAIKAPSKVAALATMMTVAQTAAAPAPASKSVAMATTPSAPEDKLCQDVRAILSKGASAVSPFMALYANDEERTKVAGLGSLPVEGFEACKIRRDTARHTRPDERFSTYYCKKTRLSETEATALAADLSKRIDTCLQGGADSVGDEGGRMVKVYEHNVGMYGFPRVRVVHQRDHAVMLHIDAQAK